MAVPNYHEIVPREIRYRSTDILEAEHPRRRAGNVETDFYWTHAPQKASFWDIAMHDKAILASEEIPGNVFTWLTQGTIPQQMPWDQRYISMSSAKVMREAFYGQSEESRTPLNGYEWLMRMHPAQDVGNIDRALEWEQPGYDAEKWAADWLKRNPELHRRWAMDEEMPVDMVEILKDTKSVPEFQYVINRQEMLYIARQNVRRWKDAVGWKQELGSMAVSGLGNWMLTDPTTVPSMMIPFGGPLIHLGKGAAPAQTVVRQGLRQLGVSGRWSYRGGKAASRLFTAPKAIHAGLATKIGQRGAVAVEMGAWVGAVDTVFQKQRMAHSEINYENDDYVRKFDWFELGMATTIGAGLGFGFGHKFANQDAVANTRRAWAEHMGGGDHHPIAHSWDYVQGGTRLDSDTIAVKRMSEALLGVNDYHLVARYMDPNLLLEVGLVPNDVRRVLQRLHDASRGKPLKTGVVMNAVNDLFIEAAGSRGAKEVVEAGLETAAQRQAWAIAFGRASIELGSEAKTEAVVALAKTKHMPKVLQEAEDRVTRMAKKFTEKNVKVAGLWDDAEMEDLFKGKIPKREDPVDGLHRAPIKVVYEGGSDKPAMVLVDAGAMGKGTRGAEAIEQEVRQLVTRAMEDAKTPKSKAKISRAMGQFIGALVGDDPAAKAAARTELRKFGVGQRVLEMEDELVDLARRRRAGSFIGPRAGGAEILKRAKALGKKHKIPVVEAAKGKKGQMILRGKGATSFYGRFGSPGTRAKEVKYLRRELDDLHEVANHRMLTTHEEKYAEKVMGRLSALTGEPHAMEGFAAKAGARYEDGRMTKPLKTKGVGTISKLISKIEREEDAVAKATDARTRKNARARLARAQKNLAQKATHDPGVERVQPETIQQKLTKLHENNDPRQHTSAGREQIVEELLDGVDLHGAELMEDSRFVGKMLTGWGLGKLSRWIALGNTGQDETLRAVWGGLREVASEFDNTKTRVHDLVPSSKKSHVTATSIKREVERRIGALVEAYAEINRTGKFGSQANQIGHQRARTEFDKQIIKHIHGAATDDPDVKKMASLWKLIKEDVERILRERGMIEADETLDWFPKRFAIGKVMANHSRAEGALTDSLWNHWLDSDVLHLRTLAKHGKIISKFSSDHETWVYITPDGETFFQGQLTRSNLKKIGVTEQEYTKMLGATPEGSLRSAVADDAIDFVAGLTDADRKVDLPETMLTKRSRGKARAQFERALPDRVLEDPLLDEFIDWRFLDLAHDYMHSTGFEVLNNQRHAARWGIRNLTMRESIRAVGNKAQKWVNDLTDSQIEAIGLSRSEIAKKMKKGIWVLNKQLDVMEGRQPILREEVGGFYEFLSQAVESIAGAVWGSGIGHSIIGTEGLGGFFGHMTRPLIDLVRRVFYALKLGRLNTWAEADRLKFLRTFGLASRQFKQHAMERLTGVNGHSSYQFGVMSRLAAPWRETGNIVAGKTSAVPGIPLTGRGKLGTIATLRAMMSNAFQVGGLDFWTTYVRMLHIQNMSDQMGHFFKAAEKTAKILKDNADVLDGLYDAAKAKAIAKGKNTRQAEAQARKELHKAWRGYVRQGGFGGTNWHVAERMARFGLLDEDMLKILRQAGEETGALIEGKLHRTIDFTKLAEWTGGSADERIMFGRALSQTTDMVEQQIHKRVSEANITQQLLTNDARGPLGRIINVMGTWARSAYDNILLEGAQMPMVPYLLMIGTFLLGETMNRVTRDLYRGREFEDIWADFEDDPDNWIAQRMFALPVMGQWTPLAREVGDWLTANQKHRTQVFSGPGIGAMDSFAGAIGSVTNTISPLGGDQIDTGAQRTLPRLLPGYRSFWWMGLSGITKGMGGPDIGGMIEGKPPRDKRIRWDFEKPDGQMRTVPTLDPEEYEGQFYPDFSEQPDYTKPFEDE